MIFFVAKQTVKTNLSPSPQRLWISDSNVLLDDHQYVQYEISEDSNDDHVYANKKSLEKSITDKNCSYFSTLKSSTPHFIPKDKKAFAKKRKPAEKLEKQTRTDFVCVKTDFPTRCSGDSLLKFSSNTKKLGKVKRLTPTQLIKNPSEASAFKRVEQLDLAVPKPRPVLSAIGNKHKRAAIALIQGKQSEKLFVTLLLLILCFLVAPSSQPENTILLAERMETIMTSQSPQSDSSRSFARKAVSLSEEGI